jgi:5-hydroxyisourate hydrolase-like protein (transthyretin family)
MWRQRRTLLLVALTIGLALWPCCGRARAQGTPADRNTPTGAKFKIAGTVVNALGGAPLGKARVLLFDTANPANVGWTITSDDGRFLFESIPPGKYALQGDRRGFIGAAYQQHEQFSTAIVTGPGLNSENLVLRLTPLASLGGRVIDESGDPVRNARVTLYVEDHQGGMNRTTQANMDSTDDQGTYEFAALGPGNYFISVAAKPWYAVHPVSSRLDGASNSSSGVPRSLDVAYPTTYFNGATDAESATPVRVAGGDHVQADIHLSPVASLHLLFHVPREGQQQGFSFPAFQKRVFDSLEPVEMEGGQSVSPGVYELTGVPAGRYTVQSRDANTGRQRQSVEMDVLKDGEELDTSASEPAASVKLSLKMPRDEPSPKETYVALQDAKKRVVGYTQVDAAGQVLFQDVAAGKYTILVNAVAKRYSVVRMVSQGVAVSEHELKVTAGASIELNVHLAEGVVSVHGFAKRAGTPMAGVMIALIPKDPESHLDMFRRDQSDSDGSFVLPGVIPGLYTLVAVEDAWGFPWLEPGALARYIKHGQDLTIGELMKGSVYLPDPVEAQPR